MWGTILAPYSYGGLRTCNARPSKRGALHRTPCCFGRTTPDGLLREGISPSYLYSIQISPVTFHVCGRSSFHLKRAAEITTPNGMLICSNRSKYMFSSLQCWQLVSCQQKKKKAIKRWRIPSFHGQAVGSAMRNPAHRPVLEGSDSTAARYFVV